MSNDFYNGNVKIKKTGIAQQFTPEQIEEYIRCKHDIIYFVKNYCKIIALGKGLQLLDLYEFQERMINAYNDRRFVINLLPRQMGKSTAVAAYLMHYVLFNEHKTVGILANKAPTAREILNRIKRMYENLPLWMQPGVKTWNKGDIELGNGSVIMAASTSSDSIRGFSMDCVSGETIVQVRDGICLTTNTIESLFDNDQTSYSTNSKKLQVFTPTGFQNFDGIKRTRGNLIEINVNGNVLRCTSNHKLLVDYQLVVAETLPHKVIPGNHWVYDLVNVAGEHLYFTNNIVSHNCIFLDEFAHVDGQLEFWESTYPVISSGDDSKVIITSTPKGMDLFYKIYTEAEKGMNDFFPIRVHWSEHPRRDERWKETTLKNIGLQQFVQEFECVTGETTVSVMDMLLDTKNNISIEDLYNHLVS